MGDYVIDVPQKKPIKNFVKKMKLGLDKSPKVCYNSYRKLRKRGNKNVSTSNKRTVNKKERTVVKKS